MFLKFKFELIMNQVESESNRKKKLKQKNIANKKQL